MGSKGESDRCPHVIGLSRDGANVVGIPISVELTDSAHFMGIFVPDGVTRDAFARLGRRNMARGF